MKGNKGVIKGRKDRGNFKKNRNAPQEEDRYFTKDDIFLSRIASILKLPLGQVKGLFYERTISVIRLNPLAGDIEKIKVRLEKSGFKLKEVPWIEGVYFVTNADKSELGQTEEYIKGLFYIQNLSSMIPALLLNPTEGEKVLDMCAAPGSKTTQIAAIMHNKGEVIAVEEDFIRMKKLENVLKEFHVKNTEIINADAGLLYKRYQNYFHKILLDAPCSGEGMIYLDSPKPLRFWSIKKIKAMAKIQKKLIKSAYLTLRPGGTLIYSTCTLEPEENEGVLEYLLNEHPDAQIEPIRFIHEPEFESFKQYTRRGIRKWSGMEFPVSVENALRITPSSAMMGFFVAKIHKPKEAHS